MTTAAFAPLSDPLQWFGRLQHAYMLSGEEGVLEEIGDLGRLIAVAEIGLELVIEVHGTVLANALADAPRQDIGRLVGAAATVLSELVMARHFALDGVRYDSSLVPEVQDPPADFVSFRPNGELNGEPPGDLYRWLDGIVGDKISVLVRQAVEDRRIAMFESKRQGGTDTIRLVLCPLRDGSGIISIRDINNFTDAREQAFQRRKLESIGQLASGLAHELNSLLQPIVSMAQMTLEDHQDDTELNEAMTIIADSARRAGELIHGMLLYVRRPTREVRPVCLEDVINSEVSVLRQSLPANACIELRTGASTGRVLIQPGEVGQIIKNLIYNAIDSMNGGGTVTITVEEIRVTDVQAVSMQVPEGRRYARLAVSDHGTGIAPSLLKRIFEPFFTSKALGQGTGLGLSIVQGLVRSCGGTISARNLPAGGAEFEVLLPSDDAPAAADRPPPVEVTSTGPKSDPSAVLSRHADEGLRQG